jgi:uncharacterized membrane protein YeiB
MTATLTPSGTETDVLGTTLPLPDRAESAASSPPGSGRLLPIDIARGLALLGMMSVHVLIGTFEEGPTGWLARVLDAPGGRASVLFFVLSGLSLALIAKQQRRSAEPAMLRRRGAALTMIGLVMAASFWGSTILHYYGLLFLLAQWLIVARRRTLLVIAALALTLGSTATMFGPWLGDQALKLPGVSNWLATQTITMLFGLYALAGWVGFFCVGIVIGRLDLTRKRVALGMAIVGIVATVGITLVSDALPGTGRGESAFDMSKFESSKSVGSSQDKVGSISEDSSIDEEIRLAASSLGADPETLKEMKSAAVEFPSFSWRELNDLNAHSNKMPWALQSLAIATAIIGAVLLTGRRLQRLLWPLAALGSISASAYVIHTVLVQDAWHWLGADSESVSITRQVVTLVGLQLTLVLIAIAIRLRWKRGPMEWLLHWLGRSSPAG